MSTLRGSIHQPNFIPWLGYFAKILQSDVFIFLDNVEYSKNSFINRNRIKVSDQVKWLTLPVSYKGNSTKQISEMTLSVRDYKADQIIHALDVNYASAPFYREIVDPIKKELLSAAKHKNLSRLNQAIIVHICKILGIDCEFRKASLYTLGSTTSSQRLCKLCQLNNIETYLSGPSGKNYLQMQPFEERNIKVEYLGRNDLILEDEELSIVHSLFKLGPNKVKKILQDFYKFPL